MIPALAISQADAVTLAAMGPIFGVLWIVARIGRRRGAPSSSAHNGRESAPTVVADSLVAVPVGTRPRRSLMGRFVEVDAGTHAGMCGWVRDLWIETATGREMATVELNNGEWLPVERALISPFFGE